MNGRRLAVFRVAYGCMGTPTDTTGPTLICRFFRSRTDLSLASKSRSRWQSHEAEQAYLPTYFQTHTFPTRCARCNVVLGAALDVESPNATSMEWLQWSVIPTNVRPPIDLLGLVLSNYLVEQMERQAIHHFVLCSMQSPEPLPRLFLWVFQPLCALAIPSSSSSHSICDACKLLYRPIAGDMPRLAHVPIVMPVDVCDALGKRLKENTSLYPPSQRTLGDWHVGWLPRRWST